MNFSITFDMSGDFPGSPEKETFEVSETMYDLLKEVVVSMSEKRDDVNRRICNG